MKLQEYLIPITTAANGTASGTTERPIFGRLYAVDVVDGTLDDNFDLTITYASPQGVTKTLLTLTNLADDATYLPRHLVHSEAGAALTGTAGGDRDLPIIAGKVTVATAEGGNVKTGAVLLYVLEG